ncbi:MAG: hypothetical protein A2821_02040 [Candidatus Magasanikbacteria bacterium RIFCSPHIGHO2_01_FULL_41_23]|uniref:Sialidase domain-containing protein n=1 Tax=Candidatus Magasanikbacteria bacterium RIFCSPLOWO2_01_FULL_40_15 TaxID=1798686 RepID=A0A1F6N2P7_9BACT|nr:MAG: hypothetical protein A2821_02040 [Candidatus Magasanikbacteria bacterium RIFCSPHIGHO2_01_FULL_41_23]OGH75092.1 MAG: hypothetical protein A3F22_04930 [Candidatus Magasanikbacteria bacterium RIFCSPHIGHO2_12_FULL_41_16]OGH78199.1 MAG: hypothetical protein A2983_00090 [Candidatus Magasanikbacteria bacterium RIFCSPLOWO2_01_FULL_40_15]
MFLWTVLISLLTLHTSSVVLAVSVSEDAFSTAEVTELQILDYVIGGGTGDNDHHVLALENGETSKLLYLTSPDGDSNFTSTTLKSSITSFGKANLLLDSGGDPHVVWTEGQGGGATLTYYKESSSATWYSTITVTSTTSTADLPGFALFETAGGTDYSGKEGVDNPIIFLCDSARGTDLVYYTVADSSGTGNSLDFIDSPYTVIGSNGSNCADVAVAVDTNDSLLLLGLGQESGDTGTIFTCDQHSGWACQDDLVTGVYSYDAQGYGRNWKDSLDLVNGGGGNFFGLFLSGNSGDTSTAVKIMKSSNGNWGSPVTIASGADIGETNAHIGVDDTLSRLWVTYFDENNDNLYIAYSDDSGTTWTTASSDSTLKIDTSMSIDNTAPESYANIAFDSAATNVLYVAASEHLGSNDYYAARYKITDLPAQSGGSSVPEFSTYVYIITFLIGFALIQHKFNSPNFPGQSPFAGA